jgi:hypothetical protein
VWFVSSRCADSVTSDPTLAVPVSGLTFTDTGGSTGSVSAVSLSGLAAQVVGATANTKSPAAMTPAARARSGGCDVPFTLIGGSTS